MLLDDTGRDGSSEPFWLKFRTEKMAVLLPLTGVTLQKDCVLCFRNTVPSFHSNAAFSLSLLQFAGV